MLYSIVIPVHNEEESLPRLIDELSAVEQEHGYAFEILLVDDGSTDSSWTVIREQAQRRERVRAIRFRRNFGKAAALNAGFEAARGKTVFTMDGDLQDDPKEIPRFLAALREGFDVVSGWKKRRYDPWHKVLPSRVFNWMIGAMTGVRLHDHNCGFKCYRKEVTEELELYGEMHRFVPVLAAAKGWRVGELVVNHRARQFGQSKYGVWRIVKGFLDLMTVIFLTGYSGRPQHLLGTLGLFSFLAGTAGLFVLTVAWVVSRLLDVIPVVHLHERAVFFYSVGAIMLGAQVMTAGFIAELVTALCRKRGNDYSIAERFGFESRAAVQQSADV
jgi:dolichol-phosphate mannosyltransferase